MSAQHPLAALKLLVISLGLILIGGTALLVGMLWKKGETGGGCVESRLDLAGRGVIVDAEREGHILRLTLEKAPGRNEFLTIDTCGGRLVGSLILETDPGIAPGQ